MKSPKDETESDKLYTVENGRTGEKCCSVGVGEELDITRVDGVMTDGDEEDSNEVGGSDSDPDEENEGEGLRNDDGVGAVESSLED